MKNLAIIDADSICYLGGKEDSLQQILDKVDYKIQEILTETKADYYVLLVSKGKYFRHDISKSKEAPEGSYKSNRTYTTQPWVKTIKEYLIVKYKAVWYPNLEADDIAAWLMSNNTLVVWGQIKTVVSFNDIEDDEATQTEEVTKILVAKDKDLLYSIPGRHLNFSKKLGPEEWGMEWVKVTEQDTRGFIQGQMIIGDASDGISGIPHKGEKYWEKMCLEGKIGYPNILNEYIQYYGISQGIFEFQKNYRLLHMLSTDEDMLREVGYIPQLPHFSECKKEVESINNF